MSADKVYDLIDQVAELGFKGKIGFHRLSESFLDPRIFDFISYAKKKGMRYVDSTNGDVLKSNPDLCNKLDGVADGLVIGLYDYKNFFEKQKKIVFWERKFKKTEIRFSLPLENLKIRRNSEIYSEYADNEAVLEQPCSRTSNLKVRYDGEVSLCCQDDLCSFGLGNVFESNIKDIWFSEKYIELVEDLKKPGSRRKYELCKKCNIPDRGKNSGKNTSKQLHQKILERGARLLIYAYSGIKDLFRRNNRNVRSRQ